MKTPRVSVIMPAYNTEKYIGEAIESILNQTFTDFEFIILNDGSTDNTAKIIKEYAKKDKRINFIDNKKNQGFIASLNQCIDIACGEYIAKMDSDDISLPERLSKQVDYLDNNPDVGMVGCGYKAFGSVNFNVIHVPDVGLLDLLRTCATTIVMFRKSIVDKYDLRFKQEFVYAEDYDFYSRFIRFAPIHNLQEILYHYRLHGLNTSIVKNEIQIKNSDIVRNNIIKLISGNNYKSEDIYNLAEHKTTKGFFLPKWLGKIVCLFILKRKNRHDFHNKYVRN